ncbi:hypothetical protein [Nocardia acidivorans]|uniref:hypothetical protein n=1 Tax=Nocardia acidivorans TaxID=404580 RepID=UPI000A85C2E4|nr:hypothetical protein [Nocardia acidivorans]
MPGSSAAGRAQRSAPVIQLADRRSTGLPTARSEDAGKRTAAEVGAVPMRVDVTEDATWRA